MIVYALDTNIISYYIKNNKAIINKVKDVTRQESKIIIPEIAYYEIRQGLLSKFTPVKTAIFN